MSVPVCNACGSALSSMEGDEDVITEFKRIGCKDGGNCEVTFTGGECEVPCGTERMLTSQDRFLQQILLNVKEEIAVEIVGSLEDVRDDEEIAVAIQDNKVQLQARIEKAFVDSGIEASADLEEIEVVYIPSTISPTSSPTFSKGKAGKAGKGSSKGSKKVAPTLAPNMTPTNRPTNPPTKGPTICKDRKDRFKLKNKHKKKRTCKFLAKKGKCNITQQSEGVKVWRLCPVSCNKCDQL